MKSKPTHRVVVTGIGAITPVGIGVTAFWNALLEGRSGVAYATRYDITTIPYVIAAEVRDFDPRDFMDAKAARRMARFAQFAVAAAGEALHDSGLNLDAIDRTQIAVDVGTSLGGTAEVEEQALAFEARGRRRVDAFYMPTFYLQHGIVPGGAAIPAAWSHDDAGARVRHRRLRDWRSGAHGASRRCADCGLWRN